MEPAVTLFVPCYVDVLRGRAGRAAVEVLECLGYPVAVRLDAICCGQPFTTTGCAEEGAAAAGLWYRRMAGAGSVVVLSSSCTVHLRHHVLEPPKEALRQLPAALPGRQARPGYVGGDQDQGVGPAGEGGNSGDSPERPVGPFLPPQRPAAQSPRQSRSPAVILDGKASPTGLDQVNGRLRPVAAGVQQPPAPA